MRNLKILCSAMIVAGLAAVEPAVAAKDTDTGRELSAQRRTSIVVRPYRSNPGPNAKRHCDAWLEKEYRLSGTVIVPKMRCVWR